MRGRKGFQSVASLFLVVGMSTSLMVATDAPRSVRASGYSTLMPHAWGGVSPSNDTVKASVYGSPAMGNVAMSSISASSPSGGGVTSAPFDANGPFGKLRWLRAFGGATPRFFAEGGTASHMLVAVRTAAGVDEVWGWGTNSKYQLGIDSTTSFATPVKVAWSPTVAGEEITALAVGLQHSLMLTSVGGTQRLYAWGTNTYGQVGDGTFTTRRVPVRVTVAGSPTFVSIAAGSYHSVAADSTGAVWVWGCDGGQVATSLTCGDLGLHGSRYVPVPTKLTDESVNQSTVPLTKKSYVNTTNVATFKSTFGGGFTLNDAVSVSVGDPSLDTTIQRITEYERTGTTVTLRFGSAHGRRVGDKVYVRGVPAVHSAATTAVAITTVPDATTLQFTSATSGTVSSTQPTSAWIHESIVTTAATVGSPSSFSVRVFGDRNAAATGEVSLATPSVTVTHRQLNSTTSAQIWFVGAHNFQVGNNITVSGVNDDGDGSQPWDGTFTVTAVSNTAGAYWVRYTVTTQPATIAQQAAPSGATVAFTTTTLSVSNVAYGSTTNLVTVTTSAPHGIKANNLVAVDLDDDWYDKSSVVVNSAPTTTTFTYRLNATLAETNAVGTATAIGCFEDAAGSSCPVAPTGVVEVAAGEGFIIARTATQVITWGTGFTNHYGRLGRTVPSSSVLTTRFAPIVLPTVDGSKPCTPREIAAGPANGLVACDVDDSNMATVDQDTLVGWGYAYYGRTGAGTTNVTSSTLAQATPTEVKACLSCINNGNTSTLGTAVTTGTSVTTFATFGRALELGENIVSIRQSAGGGYVLTDQGRVFTFGHNTGRALGTSRLYAASDGSTKELYSKAARLAGRVAPVDANGSSTMVTSLGATGYCGFVIDDENVTWSWGDCGAAHLSGRGTTGSHGYNVGSTGTSGATTGIKFDRIDVPSSARIMFMESMYRYTFVAVASGDARNDVSLWTFGSTDTQINTYHTNYPGDATSAKYLLPAKVDLPYGFDTANSSRALASVSCGELHCLSTTSDGRVYGWGDVRSGSTGSTNTGAVLPSQRVSTAGGAYTYHWDITSELTTAMGVGSLVNPRVAAGTYFSLVVDIGANSTGGRVWGWGVNTGRKASTGTTTLTAIAPTAVTDASSTVVTDVVAVSAGANHSIAIRADGSLITWGADNKGQLGNGATTSAVFASPTLPTGRIAVEVVAADDHSLVRLDDGSVIGFGVNAGGVLGNGNTTNQTSPVQVLGGHTFVDIDTVGSLRSTTVSSAVGVTANGEVYAWGTNSSGQLGRGVGSTSLASSSVPVRVLRTSGAGITGVDTVAAGSTWSAAFERYEPLQPPEPPTDVTVTPGDSSVTLSWTAPSPFREVTAYEITVSDGSSINVVAAGGGVTSKMITGLTNGTQYSFTVRSANRVGESTSTASVTATPSTVPEPPAHLDATPSSGAITLSWTTPTFDGGSPVLDYTARVFVSGADPSVDTPVVIALVSTRTKTFTSSDGLVNGSAYDVYVSARNANGSSATSASVTAVVPGRPSSPLSVTATGLPSSASVTWQAPTSDGGAAIVSYVVSAYSVPGGSLVTRTVVDSPALEYEGDGTSGLVLTNGTTYGISVAASQGGSSSDVSGAVAAMGSESTRVSVVAGRPNPPAAPAVTPGNASVTVTWTPVPDVAGITVTHYKVRAVAGSTVTSSAQSLTDSACSATCSYTLTSLTNGTTYALSVTAGVGTSDSEFGLYGASTSATPRTLPGSPVDLEAERGDRSIGVSWSPPVSDGGTPLTGYVVTVTGGASPIVVSTNASTSAVTISDLVNGTTYSVSVVATNAAGNSATPATTTQKAYTVPDAPTVTAIGPASSTISTTKKSSDGTTATLTFASATNLVEGNVVDIAGLGVAFDGTDIEITDVTTTPAHTISFAARTDDVVGESAAVGTVRLAGIYLAWDAPSNGGDAISAYNVSVTDGVNATTYIVSSGSVTLADETTTATGATTSSCPFSSRTCTVSKIESLDETESAMNVLFSNGSTYVVSVSATNNAGTGASDAPSIVVGQPDKPTGVELVADEGAFVACWADPARIPAGRSIQTYQLTATLDGDVFTKTVTAAEVAASTTCVSPKVGVEVSTFDNGTSPTRGRVYSVVVTASVTSADSAPTFGGVSAQSTVVPFGVPDAPTLEGVVVSETTATISWSAPTNTGGRSITGYEVSTSPSGFGCITTQLSCTVTDLERGTTYVFSLVSLNASGPSASVSSQSFSVPTTTTTTTTATTTVTTTTLAGQPASTLPQPTTTLAGPPVSVVPSSTTTPAASTQIVRWTQSSVRGAIGGKVLVSSTVGSTTSYTIKGRSVTLWFRAGPSGGKAVIKVNGKTRKTIDLYATKNKSIRLTVTAPTKTAKSSKVEVSVSPSKNKKSKGRTVALDAISPTATCSAGCLKNPAPPKR